MEGAGIKICVMGIGGIGKTTLCHMLVGSDPR